MEALAHDAVQQRVGDGDNRHALMVGHECPDDGVVLVLRQARTREVDGFIKAVAGQRAGAHEVPEVAQRFRRVDHGGERGGVWRDHHVLGEAPLQAEAGHAEVRILVRELEIARVVRGLRNAPGNTQRAAVGALALHHQPAGLLEQAAFRRTHHQ
ncbi:hypothetical protein D3C71_1671780 [compost metagenome]